MKPFDLTGPLPSGVTLLEASAGTGKTYTIAALTARYVAEGTPVDRLLVVTFTRSATSELRERVRHRLTTAADALGDPLAAQVDEDEVIRLLASGSAEEVAVRRERLRRAVAEFDAATIDTTHGFCLQVLSGLGVAGDVETDVTLVEDVRDLLEEVVDDLYIRKFWPGRVRPPFGRATALRIGEVVLANPGAVLVPAPEEGDDVPSMRRRLADRIVAEVSRRKRAARILTYDDVLTRLRDTLADPARGPAACRRLRQRYDVTLVDEFQDTDPVQWDIMRRAFGEGTSTLVLIGDPKQAIYAFRGADVHAYLDAGRTCASASTLTVNWRAGQPLIDALDALFTGTQLGHAGIVYRTVQAAPSGGTPDEAAPLRFRVLDRRGLPLTDRGNTSPPAARQRVADDVARQVVTITAGPVRPGDVAVLVGTNRQAGMVRDALLAAGVPAVVAGAGSVFASRPAEEWLQLLEALEQPTSRSRAAAVALTAFVGWSAEEVATASDDTWEDLHWSLHRWAALLRDRGVAALLEHLTTVNGVPARVLARPAGERWMTDLGHVAELMHAAAVREELGSTALTAWLRARIVEADPDRADEDRSRRLESDADAVQVLTVHRSKGLEFPVVLCPYLWDDYTPTPEVPVFHDGARTIDVGGPESATFAAHCRLHIDEERGEDLRLMYVALTRAKRAVVVWWAGTYGSRRSPLGRLLFARDGTGVVASEASGTPDDGAVVARLEALGDRVAVEVFSGAEPSPPWIRPAAPAVTLAAARFDRELDRGWRRTSYTAVTSTAHDARVASEADTDVKDDERPVGVLEPAGPPAGLLDSGATQLPLGGLPGGTETGTLVHRVLEAIDFAAADLHAELRAALVEAGTFDDPEGVAAALAAVIDAPLTGGLRLRDVARRDRLDELAFELPLVGGDAPGGELAVPDLAPVLRAHLPAGDRLAGYADRLADPAVAAVLRGYLTGSIDLVMRLPDGRFALADYKTNRLAPADVPLVARHYSPAALDAEMWRAHYPLQALFYAVALHRYLRWRAPGAEVGRVLYLFVRGMTAPGAGVWSWEPPAGLLGALSDVFDQGASR